MFENCIEIVLVINLGSDPVNTVGANLKPDLIKPRFVITSE